MKYCCETLRVVVKNGIIKNDASTFDNKIVLYLTDDAKEEVDCTLCNHKATRSTFVPILYCPFCASPQEWKKMKDREKTAVLI